MSYNVLLEDLITDIGGCGRYQWLSGTIVHVAKTFVAWSMIAMSFNGQVPEFWCTSNLIGQNETGNATEYNITEGSCSANNYTDCSSYTYGGDMYTVVVEWDLVCGRKWMIAMITTIQMGGVFVGCMTAGHIGDAFGRKPTFFAAIFIIVVFNIVGYFSINWQMYAAFRFLIGTGIGFYFTIQYNLMLEFVTISWRPRVVAVPSWPLEASSFALLAWGLKDWKKIHLVTAAAGIPFLFTFWLIQESFRWLMTKERYGDAESIIHTVAKINRHPAPNLTKILTIATDNAKRNEGEKTTYSFVDLFKTKTSIVTTLGLAFIWMSISYSYYGLTFGVSILKGNLYLNMFLINIVEAPGTFLYMAMINRLGRKKSCMVWYLIVGASGLVAGIMQYIDTPARDNVTLACALICKLGIMSGWGSLIVLSTESYPTAVRTIAYGLCNAAARIGGMAAPQVVFLNDDIPGIMFFMSGGLMIISALICLLFTETNGQALQDNFHSRAGEVTTDKEVEINGTDTTHM